VRAYLDTLDWMRKHSMGDLIRVPRSKAARRREARSQEVAEALDSGDVREAMRLDVNHVRRERLVSLSYVHHVDSRSGDSLTVESVLAAPGCFDQVETADDVESLLAGLSELERLVVVRAFGMCGHRPQDDATTAGQVGLSAWRVGEVRGRALLKLKQAAARAGRNHVGESSHLFPTLEFATALRP
jgi:DNA-directed RNA polymerase sigma subunit (sigma70/sigma32)